MVVDADGEGEGEFFEGVVDGGGGALEAAEEGDGVAEGLWMGLLG